MEQLNVSDKFKEIIAHLIQENQTNDANFILDNLIEQGHIEIKSSPEPELVIDELEDEIKRQLLLNHNP